MKSGIIGTYFSTPSFLQKSAASGAAHLPSAGAEPGCVLSGHHDGQSCGRCGRRNGGHADRQSADAGGFRRQLLHSDIRLPVFFFGAGNRRNLKRCFGLQLLLNVCIALAFFLLAKLGGTWFLSFFQRRRPAHRSGEAVHLHQRLFLFLHRAHQRVHVHVPQRAEPRRFPCSSVWPPTASTPC